MIYIAYAVYPERRVVANDPGLILVVSLMVMLFLGEQLVLNLNMQILRVNLLWIMSSQSARERDVEIVREANPTCIGR